MYFKRASINKNIVFSCLLNKCLGGLKYILFIKRLQNCELTAASMEALAAALCSGKSELRKVDLTQNKIGDLGVEALCKSLQHPLCKLQSVM